MPTGATNIQTLANYAQVLESVITGECVECTGHFVPVLAKSTDAKSHHQFSSRVQHVHVRVTASQALRFAACTQQVR